MKAVHIILALCLCIIMQSCVHVPEFTSNYDIVFGDEYSPNVKLLSKENPGRTLVIPVINNVDAAYSTILLHKFKDNLSVYELVWLKNEKCYEKAPIRTEVDRLASEYNCTSVLILQIRHLSAYEPIRATVDIVVERLADNLTIIKGACDYDARNELVANSARRYFQLILRRQNEPDKSLSILRTNPDFFEFCGWHLAKFINYIVVPPIKDLNKDLNDPKNIHDFEPTEVPDAPIPVKKVNPTSQQPVKDAKPKESLKGGTILNQKKQVPETKTNDSINTTEKTTSEEKVTPEIPSSKPPQKFEEPPTTLQTPVKEGDEEDSLKSEKEHGSYGGKSLWLKNH